MSEIPASFTNPSGWRKKKKLPKTAGQKAEERKIAIQKAMAKRNEGRCEAEVTRQGKKRRCDFDKGHFGTTHKSRIEHDGKTSFVWWDTRTREVWFENYEEGKLL